METTCASLFYQYPEALVATEPAKNFRAMYVLDGHPREVSKSQLLESLQPGDLLVLNNTKVKKRRIFSQCGLEILFIQQVGEEGLWEVLFPVKRMKSSSLVLPDGVRLKLISKGLPQTVLVSGVLDESYFIRNGELALPPYIQKSRGRRHNIEHDETWYQTHWAKVPGSLAAPTASLHFKEEDLLCLQKKGVLLDFVTLHVGLGTFLPIKTEKLSDHKMHKEFCEISVALKDQIEKVKAQGNRVWALGTTVARSLESLYTGHLELMNDRYTGQTDLFITPGFEFRAVDVLMTNFHQPGSTLMALVAAFSGLETTLKAYEWAIENKFKLFSYGDLSVWEN